MPLLAAFNTTLIGMGRIPACAVCPDLLTIDTCRVERGKRLRDVRYTVPKGIDTTITIYTGGDAVSIRCVTCDISQHCGNEPTPSDVKYKLILQDGNVYALITDGRQDQFLHITVRITLESGKEIPAYRNVVITKQLC